MFASGLERISGPLSAVDIRADADGHLVQMERAIVLLPLHVGRDGREQQADRFLCVWADTPRSSRQLGIPRLPAC